MGQTLSEPQTTKHTSYGEDDRLLFAVSEMQGWRLCEWLQSDRGGVAAAGGGGHSQLATIYTSQDHLQAVLDVK